MGIELRRDLTLILGRVRARDEWARGDLVALVYDELCQVASNLIRRDLHGRCVGLACVLHGQCHDRMPVR